MVHCRTDSHYGALRASAISHYLDRQLPPCKVNVYPGRPDRKMCTFVQLRGTPYPCFSFFFFFLVSATCIIFVRFEYEMTKIQVRTSGVPCGLTPYHFDIALHIITKSPRLAGNLECQLISCTPLHFFGSYVLSPGRSVAKRRTLPTYHDGGSSYSAPVFRHFLRKKRGSMSTLSAVRPHGRFILAVPRSPQMPMQIALKSRPKVRSAYNVQYTMYNIQYTTSILRRRRDSPIRL